MNKKVLILKNDRTGDLFVSLKAINRIINKHNNQQIYIFLSNINHKFSFLFPILKKRIISMKLNLIDKIKIFNYLLFNKIDTIYILTPKNFYYYLPFIFRNIKFYAITIKAKKNRPSKFFLKYLYKYVEIDRLKIKKRKSSYDIQESLIEFINNTNNLSSQSKLTHNFKYPKEFVIFHYKMNLFQNLLKWDIDKASDLIEFLNKKYKYVLFSSEINNDLISNYFSKKFNQFDFPNNKEIKINDKNIFFLKDVDGYNLFDVVKKSSKVISPEGIMTHIGYFLKKPVLALMHFNLNDRQDFINQIISCKEWFPPNNYQYIVLKKNFSKSIKKLESRI